MSNYTFHAEAACCIWEELLEIQRTTNLREPGPIWKCFDQRGTSEMRHAAISLSVLCCEVWDKLPVDERPDCFDWDFVPGFVHSLTWDAEKSSVVEVPTLDEALKLYRAHWADCYGVPA